MARRQATSWTLEPSGAGREQLCKARHLKRIRPQGRLNLGANPLRRTRGSAENSQVPPRETGKAALPYLGPSCGEKPGLAQARHSPPPPEHPSKGDSLSVSSCVRSQAKYGARDRRCRSKQIFLEKTIWQRMSRTSSVTRCSVIFRQANVLKGNASIPPL